MFNKKEKKKHIQMHINKNYADYQQYLKINLICKETNMIQGIQNKKKKIEHKIGEI